MDSMIEPSKAIKPSFRSFMKTNGKIKSIIAFKNISHDDGNNIDVDNNNIDNIDVNQKQHNDIMQAIDTLKNVKTFRATSDIKREQKAIDDTRIREINQPLQDANNEINILKGKLNRRDDLIIVLKKKLLVEMTSNVSHRTGNSSLEDKSIRIKDISRQDDLKLTRLQDQVADLKDSIKKHEESINGYITDTERLKLLLNNFKNEKVTLQMKIRDIELENKKITKQVNAKENINKILHKELDISKQESVDYGNSLTKCKDLEIEIFNLNKIIGVNNIENKGLKKEIFDLHEAHDNFVFSIREDEDKNESIYAKYDKLLEELDNLVANGIYLPDPIAIISNQSPTPFNVVNSSSNTPIPIDKEDSNKKGKRKGVQFNRKRQTSSLDIQIIKDQLVQEQLKTKSTLFIVENQKNELNELTLKMEEYVVDIENLNIIINNKNIENNELNNVLKSIKEDHDIEIKNLNWKIYDLENNVLDLNEKIEFDKRFIINNRGSPTNVDEGVYLQDPPVPPNNQDDGSKYNWLDESSISFLQKNDETEEDNVDNDDEDNKEEKTFVTNAIPIDNEIEISINLIALNKKIAQEKLSAQWTNIGLNSKNTQISLAKKIDFSSQTNNEPMKSYCEKNIQTISEEEYNDELFGSRVKGDNAKRTCYVTNVGTQSIPDDSEIPDESYLNVILSSLQSATRQHVSSTLELHINNKNNNIKKKKLSSDDDKPINKLLKALIYVSSVNNIRNKFVQEIYIKPRWETINSRNCVKCIDILLQTIHYLLCPPEDEVFEEEYSELYRSLTDYSISDSLHSNLNVNSIYEQNYKSNISYSKNYKQNSKYNTDNNINKTGFEEKQRLKITHLSTHAGKGIFYTIYYF
jgi:hypothetical protein